VDIEKAIAELRSRNEPVPEPIRLPTEEELEVAQEQLGIPFPADYRRFQLEAGDVTFSTLEPFVVVPTMPYLDLIRAARKAWEIGVPRAWLPFCENNGDYYCLDGTAVRYWANGPTDETWSDLATWITQVWIGGS